MAEKAALSRGSVEAFQTPEYSGAAAVDSFAPILPTGGCAAIARVKQLIGQLAAFDTNVLVLGESGTGKEVVARAIHEASARRRRAFVPINCGAIPAELLESELFGHERGAFTGALSARKGRFEIAEGGTIFLDEIGDMNPTMQVKLLRVLQERVYERVGSCVSQRCNVRVIAATHRNLEEAIARGTFREDLYYRLNVVPIEMPPLRERIEDLPQLIAALTGRLAAAGQPRVQFSAAAFGALSGYRWPGNVRELGNLIERMAVQYGERTIGIAELPPRYRPLDWESSEAPLPQLLSAMGAPTPLLAPPPPESAGTNANSANPAGEPGATLASAPSARASTEIASRDAGIDTAAAEAEPPPMAEAFADALLSELPRGFDLREYLESLERRLIVRALHSAGGTVAQAARLLGLRRTTLVEKLRKYALGGSEEPAAET
jgi:sigma-54 specific flagellar transcriptional regulator A